MRKLSKSGILIIGLAIALFGVTVYAAIQVTRNIENTVTVAGVYDITVYEQDGTTGCSSIAWGTLAEGSSSQHLLWINNTGSGAAAEIVYVGWQKQSFPASGFSLTGEYIAGTWQPWAENVYNLGTMELSPGESVQVRFTLSNTGASKGDYSFNIAILGADSISG